MSMTSQTLTQKNHSYTRAPVSHKWESYPLNLLGYDVAEVDLGAYHARWNADISRILEGITKLQALTVKHPIDSRGTKTSKDTTEIKSLVELEKYLMVEYPFLSGSVENLINVNPLQSRTESSSSFLTISQRYSWATLDISSEALEMLLTHLKVYPGFLDVLHTFGEKIQEQDEDFVIYNTAEKSWEGPAPSEPSTFEIYYNFKYVQKIRNLNEPDNPMWSVQKMGVYSKYDSSSDSTAWIFIQPSDYFSRRLEEVFAADASTNSQKRRHDFETHLLVLQSASHNWILHINDMEKEFKRMHYKAFVEFKDAQQIQRLKENLLELLQTLDINHGVASRLRESFREFQQKGPKFYVNEEIFRKCDLSLELLLLHTSQHKDRVENLIRRTDGLYALVPFMFAQIENSVMLKLSEKSTQYARSMKVITIFTMIYLPPSFVASFFGIQFFSWGPSGSIKLEFEVVYFFATCIVLMALTFGIWWVWERRSEKAERLVRNIDEEQF